MRSRTETINKDISVASVPGKNDDDDDASDGVSIFADNDDVDDSSAVYEDTKHGRKKRDVTATATEASPTSKRVCTTFPLVGVGLREAVLANDGLVDTIFSFLDIRSLLQVSQAQKSSFASLIRYEHVIQSACSRATGAPKRIQAVMKLIKSRKIWTPSPMRLLRLMNGRRCEGCHKPIETTATATLPSFGVFLCGTAENKFGFRSCAASERFITDIYSDSDSDKYGPLLKRGKLASQRSCRSTYYTPRSGNYRKVWQLPYKDARGERCGPILSLKVDDKNGRPTKNLTTNNAKKVVRQYRKLDSNAKLLPIILQMYQNVEQSRKQQLLKAISNAMGDHPLKELALNSDLPAVHRFWRSFRRDCGLQQFLDSSPWSQPSEEALPQVCLMLKSQLDLILHFGNFGFLDGEILNTNFNWAALQSHFRTTFPNNSVLLDPRITPKAILNSGGSKTRLLYILFLKFQREYSQATRNIGGPPVLPVDYYAP